jgi:integrase
VIERTNSGRWKVTVDVGTRAARRRVTRTVSGEREDAQRLEAQLRRDPDAARRRTVLDALDRYLVLHGPAMAPNTENNARSRRRRYIEPTWFGDVPLDKLDTATVETFLAQIVGGTYAPGAKAKSAGTAKSVRDLISVALGEAKRAGWVRENVAKGARVYGAAASTFDDYDIADVGRVLDAAPDDDDLVEIVHAAIATSARIGELCALRWRDVNMFAGNVAIYGTVSPARRSAGAKGVTRKGTKTGRPRRVRLDAAALAMFEGRYRRQMAAATAIGLDDIDDRAVFSRTLERDVTAPKWFQNRWRSAAAKAGVTLRFHDLRHISASEMMAANVPVPEASNRTGHASRKLFFDTYGHRRADADDAATIALADAWQRARPGRVAAGTNRTADGELAEP